MDRTVRVRTSTNLNDALNSPSVGLDTGNWVFSPFLGYVLVAQGYDTISAAPSISCCSRFLF
jgi:hypothetical protein